MDRAAAVIYSQTVLAALWHRLRLFPLWRPLGRLTGVDRAVADSDPWRDRLVVGVCSRCDGDVVLNHSKGEAACAMGCSTWTLPFRGIAGQP